MPITDFSLEAWCLALERAEALERLERICELAGYGVVFTSSFGQEDQVIIDMIARYRLPVRVCTLDTGRLFHETYALMDRTRARYAIALETFFPEAAQVEQLVASKGFHSFYESVENRQECCYIRKVAPLKRALEGARIWVTGLRAGQSEHRQTLPVVEWDAAFGLWKINPLVDWTLEQIRDYIRQYDVPYNTLHDQGFPSIGCAPCTRAIQPGEDIRAGRWWWEQTQKECGLHAR